MKNQIQMVLKFHEVFDCFICQSPQGRIPQKEMDVRLKLIQEELDEYKEAALAGDTVAVADALTDLLYVVFGTLIAHGMQDKAEELFTEVHRSNMSKLDENGQPIHREDGKVLKSELFSGPDLEQILTRAD